MTYPDETAEAGNTPKKLFSSTVQKMMEGSAAARDVLRARWPAGTRLQCSDPDSIYHGYPYLFLEAFPSLTLAEVEPLARGAGLIFDAIIVADHVMDQETEHVTADVLGVEALQFEGYRVLYGAIPPDRTFWQRFHGYLAAYAQACLEERALVHPGASWADFDEEKARAVAVGKCSVAKIAVAGLAELAGDDSPLEDLVQSIEHYYFARQMLDDLSDWRKDLEQGFPSLLLARVAAAAFGGDRGQMAAQVDSTRREIYFGGHVAHTMQLALQAITGSDRHTAVYPNLAWQRQTLQIRQRCEAVLAQIQHLEGSRTTTTRSLAVTLPAPTTPWQELAWAALRRILVRWGAGSASAGEQQDVTSKVGDVLPLALVTDSLCDADTLLAGQLQPLIQSQAEYLLRRRQAHGGWSYAAVSMDLPPDTDHLGLVLRALLRSSRRPEVEQHCEALLQEVLEKATLREDGAIETWIRPWSGNPPLPACGPDVLVTAQMMEALALYKPGEFDPILARGASWIEGCQLEDGSWRSLLYRGPFLATAACLRFLLTARPESPAFTRAADFLRRALRDGDGQTTHSARERLKLALALQGLAIAQQGGAGSPQDLEIAERARQTILLGQGGGDLTTAFVLRAAVLWHRWVENSGEMQGS